MRKKGATSPQFSGIAGCKAILKEAAVVHAGGICRRREVQSLGAEK